MRIVSLVIVAILMAAVGYLIDVQQYGLAAQAALGCLLFTGLWLKHG